MMQLKIEFLGTNKAGRFIMLNESLSDIDLPAFDILENDAISVSFSSEHHFHKVLLLLGDREFECTCDAQYNSQIYKWIPERFDKGYKALFHNFFGIAELAIKLIDSGGYSIRKFQPIEIYSSTMTATQCESMLEYLASKKNVGLLNSLSPTGFNAAHVKSGISPGDLVDQICKAVLDAEIYCKGILQNPIKKINCSPTLVDGSQYDAIDEPSIGWIAENSSVLTESESIECAHFNYDETWYHADEILASKLINSTDIYENRLIHFFIKKLKVSCKDKLEELRLHSMRKPSPKYTPYGFVSFFDVMNRITGRNFDKKIEKMNSCISTLERLDSLLRHRAPVKNIDIKKIGSSQNCVKPPRQMAK